MAYEDLLKDTSTVSEDGNYFIVTITDLDPDDAYPVQLRWKYKDGSFSSWSAVKTLPLISSIQPPANPSVPTVTPVLGAIEVSWDGKTSTGANQTNQSDYAKVYIGTSSSFTPIDSGSSANYVDILDFANKKNSIYIGVESEINPSFTIAYDTDYYIKIQSYNSKGEASAVVAATGNPVRVGKVSNSGIVEVTADKIRTGTLNANASITVGNTSGKHVKISGSGDPILVYGSGGVSAGAKLDFTESGDLKITGAIYALDGYFGKSGEDMKIGYNVNGTNDGIYMGTNNYWYNTGIFNVGSSANHFMNWDGETLTIQGYLGGANGWTVSADTIASRSSDATIDFSDGGKVLFGTAAQIEGYDIDGTQFFRIWDPISYQNILATDATNNGRVVIGDISRQAEVGKSAQVAGTANSNSGGLRNMYTITSSGYTSNPSVYLTDNYNNGDVLLVWTP